MSHRMDYQLSAFHMLALALAGVGKQAFTDQAIARVGRPGVICINAHGYVACAFANLAWAILHPWYAEKYQGVK